VTLEGCLKESFVVYQTVDEKNAFKFELSPQFHSHLSHDFEENFLNSLSLNLSFELYNTGHKNAFKFELQPVT